MNGRYVFDTNFVLHYYTGHAKAVRLYERLGSGSLYVSVISRMELLSFHGITAEEEAQLRWIINETTVIPLNSTVEDIAIQFRRATRCKLPDAVVAASAVAVGATLVTND